MILDVPFFPQEHWWTCGPACLRMALAALGVDQSEEELAELSGTDFSGATCDQLAEAAEKLGLQADVIENLSVQDLRKVLESGSPFIALLDAGVFYTRHRGVRSSGRGHWLGTARGRLSRPGTGRASARQLPPFLAGVARV